MSPRNYFVPHSSSTVEYEVKKSRFIATAAFANSRECALDQLASSRTLFPDARHHCWAYLIGDPLSPHTVAMSDDGEPSGTAGKPILNVLQHKHIGNVMLIVVRYFGGIKLGAGGLVRAYSSAAQMVMSQLETVEEVAYMSVRIVGDYSFEQPLRHWLDVNKGRVISVAYSEKVLAEIAIIYGQLEQLEAFAGALGAHILAVDD